MDFAIIPYVGVGPLRFGMNVHAVRSALGEPVKPFQKGTDPGEHLTDAFDGLGVHVFYKEDGTCEAVEFMRSAHPTLNGQEMCAMAFKDVRRFIRGLDAKVEVDDDGLTSFALGIAIYCPADGEGVREAVEAVLVFARGYYDNVDLDG